MNEADDDTSEVNRFERALSNVHVVQIRGGGQHQGGGALLVHSLDVVIPQDAWRCMPLSLIWQELSAGAAYLGLQLLMCICCCCCAGVVAPVD
jgi:hypothetical protein